MSRSRLILAAALLLAAPAVAQTARLTPEAHATKVLEFQRELDADYRDPAHSPLPEVERRGFTGLPFFAPDYRYYVEATFEYDSLSQPFQLPTTKPRLAPYRRYGALRFVLDGQPQRLTVYRGLDVVKKAGYENYLFVPFTDATSGHETYGGGRYLDLRSPLGVVVQLDFNRAYNPYCAYSSKYSCPIPPPENALTVPIRAGVKSDY